MYATDACANIEMMTASYARLACAQCIKQKNRKKSEKGKKNVDFLLNVVPSYSIRLFFTAGLNFGLYIVLNI